MRVTPPRFAFAILLTVSARAAAQAPADDADAHALLAAVIARRQAALTASPPCRYDAYIKTAAFDLGAPPDSATSVLFLTETEIAAYWEHPDHFQETIEARHRPSEGGLGRSPAVAEEIEHFQRDYVVISDARDPGAVGSKMLYGSDGHQTASFTVPLPFGRDGLRNYRGLVIDTVSTEQGSIFRLTIGPRGHGPRFAGTIDVDSSLELVAVDLRLNEVVHFPGVDSLRYQEAFVDSAGARWPREIRLSGHLERRISARWLPKTVVGMPMPDFPRSVHFEELATISAFEADTSVHPADLLDYRRISRISAYHSDTGVVWKDTGAAPLSAAEQAEWATEDSEELHPRMVPRVVRDANIVQDAAFGPGSDHYNRVDGLYLGAAHNWRANPLFQVTGKLGYALGREQWQYRVGARVVLLWPQQLWIGVAYRDETAGWPSLVPTTYDATASALVNGVDPNEYFRNHGGTASAGIRLLPYTRLEIRYDDMHQSTLDTLSDSRTLLAGSFRSSRSSLPNPPIIDGHLRSVGGTLTFDSRQLTRSRLGEGMMSQGSWTQVSFAMDVSAHDVLASDFSYRRYSVHLEHQQRWAAAGVTTVNAVAGMATGFTPPQQYFTVGYGIQVLAAEGSAFNTLSRSEYGGTRAAMILVRHDFGQLLFAGSGLPVLRVIPATFSLHGGVFWTDLQSQAATPAADSVLLRAQRAYVETGFTLGNLTPFINPVDFAISCTWQLSHYPTNRFRFGIGFTGF
ncbi:MAG TPA: hypothetical protein VEV39_03090 [Gemmatimonadales bacterium]|nr:hypothetical protein [Gemmatimonadales bacterium]